MSESNSIQPSSFNLVDKGFSVISFLRLLGIDFIKCQGFWKGNEAQLEYLFVDLCKRGREIKVALHPQKGGDPLVFSRFVAQLDKTKRLFYQHGIRYEGDIRDAVDRKEKSKIRNQISSKLSFERHKAIRYQRINEKRRKKKFSPKLPEIA